MVPTTFWADEDFETPPSSGRCHGRTRFRSLAAGRRRAHGDRRRGPRVQDGQAAQAVRADHPDLVPAATGSSSTRSPARAPPATRCSRSTARRKAGAPVHPHRAGAARPRRLLRALADRRPACSASSPATGGTASTSALGGGYRFATLDKKVDADALLCDGARGARRHDHRLALRREPAPPRRAREHARRTPATSTSSPRTPTARASSSSGTAPKGNTDFNEDVYEACAEGGQARRPRAALPRLRAALSVPDQQRRLLPDPRSHPDGLRARSPRRAVPRGRRRVIELKEFQKQAADQIAERFKRYYDDPPWRGTQQEPAGRALLPGARVDHRVGQDRDPRRRGRSRSARCCRSRPSCSGCRRARSSSSRPYANLVGRRQVPPPARRRRVDALAEYDADDVRDSTKPLVYFATVGTFNQKDKEEGVAADLPLGDRHRRVSDLGGAQGCAPDADDTAGRCCSSTTKVTTSPISRWTCCWSSSRTASSPRAPPCGCRSALAAEIKHLKDEGWTDEDLVTSVDARAVADSGLVKSTVLLGGYEAPMEETIDSLIEDMRDAEKEAAAHGLGTAEGDLRLQDEHRRRQQPAARRPASSPSHSARRRRS